MVLQTGIALAEECMDVADV